MGINEKKQFSNYSSPRRKREKGAENLFKQIMAEIFPNLGRNFDIQVHEAYGSPNKLT